VGTATIIFRGTAREFPFIEVIEARGRRAKHVVPAARPNHTAAPAAAPSSYLNVFTVEEYENNGKTGKKWTKIGVAFPHKENTGFSIELNAFPIDGRLVVLPPDTDDGNSRNGK